MRIGIVHYHLWPGGVTRVIENTFTALAERPNRHCVVLCSEPYEGNEPLRTRVVPGLAYTWGNEKPDPGALWFSVKQAARDSLGGPPDLWHIHNHSLGKNTAFPQLVQKLAAEVPVLLQMHDFAEDGRPENYGRILDSLPEMGWLYPQAAQVHYAVINGRDYQILGEAGFPKERLHLLPNPVAIPDIPAAPASLPDLPGDRLFLYPTRGIRRKNLGEMLLWSAVARDGDFFASTLAPANREWLPVHDRWKAFAKELKLPAALGFAEQTSASFEDLMGGAEAVLTTSVAEGFGLAFVEPFLFGQKLFGRNLPAITADFTQKGVDLGGLYDELRVPLEWVGEAAVKQSLHRGLRQSFEAYRRELPEAAADHAFKAMTHAGRIEFGRIDEPLQECVLQRLAGDRGAAQAMAPNRLETEVSAETIHQNRDKIASELSVARFADRLTALYDELAAIRPERIRPGDAGAVLDQFLQPERFNLLRC